MFTFIPFGSVLIQERPFFQKTFYALFFGAVGIAGTYAGGHVSESFANIRAMGVVTAGLVGGPVVGAGAGLIAGVHRFLIDMSGFSSIPCSIATICEGITAGVIFKFQHKIPDWRYAGMTALAGESIHMLLVLFLSKPYSEALALVKIISLPMIVSNTIGASLFSFVLLKLKEFKDKDYSDKAELLLETANETVVHLREGLNYQSADKTCRIIYEKFRIAGVSITDREMILAHVGEGDDHHKSGIPLQTDFTKNVLKSGEPEFGRSRDIVSCSHENCPITAAIVIPLRKQSQIIGSLKFYGSRKRPLENSFFEIARGLGQLFSTQLELEEIAVKEKLIAKAEVRRLNAQIQPHFLFNAMNTIASFCRTDPLKARGLILDLALYMRKNLDSEGGFIRLEEEMQQVRAYISIEKARFGDRILYEEDIEPGIDGMTIPQLIIQPLVENAVRHGLKSVEKGGVVKVKVSKDEKMLNFSVSDNGCGISETIINDLFSSSEISSEHIGLKNCHERLKNLYGEQSGVNVDCSQGSRIFFSLPYS